MKKRYILLFVLLVANGLFAQKLEPKYTFNVEIGLPIAQQNTPFKDVMQGLASASIYQQYSFPFHLNLGAGVRYSLFTIDEFAVPDIVFGSMHTAGAYVKLGYDKFITDRFAVDFGVKVGYSLNFSNSREENPDGEIINRTNLTNESMQIEPVLGLILLADERTSYRFTIGYNIQGQGFSPRFIGLNTDSNWDPNRYSSPTQFLIVGFGFTYYFRKDQ